MNRSTGKLEVRVPPVGSRSAAQQRLIDSLGARFGGLVVFTVKRERMRPAACSYPYCDPPLRAGIRITVPGSSCTGAFLARSRSDAKLYQLTAGHCNVDPGTAWSTRFVDESTHVIGPIHRGVFGSRGDASIIRVNNPSGWRARAWVLVTAGSGTTANSEYPIRGTGRSAVGMRVCVTGGWYGESNCGTVTAVDVTVDYGDAVVAGLVEATLCITEGDSGGPVYARNTAFGLVSGTSDICDSVYEPIGTAENLLNVNVARDSG